MKDDEFFEDWNEFIRENSIGELEKGEITIRMFAKKAKITVSAAGRILNALYPNGASRRWVREDGRRVYAYRIRKSET